MSSVTTSSLGGPSLTEQNHSSELHNLRFEATSLAEMNGELTPWLWPERIPLGAVTLFCGDPEIGKSFATLDIAARVSSGAAWPEEEGKVGDGRVEEGGNADGTKLQQPVGRDSERSEEERTRECLTVVPSDSHVKTNFSDSSFTTHNLSLPGSVLLLSAEDNARQTILPRLQRMNADLSKIHLLRSIRSGNNESTFSLARDIQELEYAAMTLGDCKLIVIDPITSYLQGAAWTNAVMIRTVLDPLKALAERTGAAVILVNHLTKTKSAAMYRSLGSISIVGMCRVAWLFTRDTSDPERRLMLPLKNNLVASRSGLSYRVTDGLIEWRADPYKMGRAGSIDFNFKERELDAIDEAMLWVYNRLKNGEEEQCKVIEQDARQAGISRTTLRRACDKLKVVSRPVSSRGTWMWSLPILKNQSF